MHDLTSLNPLGDVMAGTHISRICSEVHLRLVKNTPVPQVASEFAYIFGLVFEWEARGFKFYAATSH